MAKRMKQMKFGELPVGARFMLPKTGTVGRRPVFTKTSGRSYQTRVGEKVQTRAASTMVELVK